MSTRRNSAYWDKISFHVGCKLTEKLSDWWSHLVISSFFVESFNFSTIWTSGKRPEGGARNEFYWTNSGKPLVYENWRKGQPYRGASDSDCVTISKKLQYKWNDSGCISNHYTALCEWWGILHQGINLRILFLHFRILYFNTLITCFRVIRILKIKLFL